MTSIDCWWRQGFHRNGSHTKISYFLAHVLPRKFSYRFISATPISYCVHPSVIFLKFVPYHFAFCFWTPECTTQTPSIQRTLSYAASKLDGNDKSDVVSNIEINHFLSSRYGRWRQSERIRHTLSHFANANHIVLDRIHVQTSRFLTMHITVLGDLLL